jgi:hypothetical protein
LCRRSGQVVEAADRTRERAVEALEIGTNVLALARPLVGMFP